MLTIFVKDGCRFSRKVMDAVIELGIEVVYKNKKEDGVIDELVALGGKEQFPYLIDDERGVGMYEADDIVQHLKEHYGK